MNRIAKDSKATASKMVLRKRKAESFNEKNISDKRFALGEVTNKAAAAANTNKKSAFGVKNVPSKSLHASKSIIGGKSKFIITTEAAQENKTTTTTSSKVEILNKQNIKETQQQGLKIEHVEPQIKMEVKSEAQSSNNAFMNAKNVQVSQDAKAKLPDGVLDFDLETADDPYQVGLYAADIFSYYKRREVRFPIKKYLDKQTEINRNMRSILVDWMVEVQESFELNHETLYLAVKLVDMFLSKTMVKRDKLQLLGTTAMYLAAKYDERCPPVIDDFCYICDDAYPQRDVIKMEMSILKTLNFDIGVPLSYRFLRRYARCTKADMETLTLARYILETSLTDYDFIDIRDSMVASACLLLARSVKGLSGAELWNPTLEYHSGYSKVDLFDLCHRLFNVIQNPPTNLKTIRAKYSHSVFYSVAKIPLPEKLKL